MSASDPMRTHAIQVRDQALGSGRAVLIVGQHWDDVYSLLAGLGVERYRLFDLGKPWGLTE